VNVRGGLREGREIATNMEGEGKKERKERGRGCGCDEVR
jgi:hypothetical protein